MHNNQSCRHHQLTVVKWIEECSFANRSFWFLLTFLHNDTKKITFWSNSSVKFEHRGTIGEAWNDTKNKKTHMCPLHANLVRTPTMLSPRNQTRSVNSWSWVASCHLPMVCKADTCSGRSRSTCVHAQWQHGNKKAARAGCSLPNVFRKKTSMTVRVQKHFVSHSAHKALTDISLWAMQWEQHQQTHSCAKQLSECFVANAQLFEMTQFCQFFFRSSSDLSHSHLKHPCCAKWTLQSNKMKLASFGCTSLQLPGEGDGTRDLG